VKAWCFRTYCKKNYFAFLATEKDLDATQMEDITKCMHLKHESDCNNGTLHRLAEARKAKSSGRTFATDAMRRCTARTLAIAAIGAATNGKGPVMAVPLARAIVMIVAAVGMAATTAGQATAVKNSAAEDIAVMTKVTDVITAVTATTLTSLSSIALTSKTARFTSHTSTRGKNTAQIHTTRNFTIVSSTRAIIKLVMTTMLAAQEQQQQEQQQQEQQQQEQSQQPREQLHQPW